MIKHPYTAPNMKVFHKINMPIIMAASGGQDEQPEVIPVDDDEPYNGGFFRAKRHKHSLWDEDESFK